MPSFSDLSLDEEVHIDTCLVRFPASCRSGWGSLRACGYSSESTAGHCATPAPSPWPGGPCATGRLTSPGKRMRQRQWPESKNKPLISRLEFYQNPTPSATTRMQGQIFHTNRNLVFPLIRRAEAPAARPRPAWGRRGPPSAAASSPSPCSASPWCSARGGPGCSPAATP